MSLLEGLRAMAARRRDLVEVGEGPDPFGLPVASVSSATEAVIDGRPIVMAGTNNYLGMTFHPACIRAAREALEEAGTGTTGSRMANGTYSHHLALERELAGFFGRRHAVVFSTGYMANAGMISALLGRDDVAMLDADCHASIYDGCSLTGADVLRFRHNDADSLEQRLRRLGDRTPRTLVIVEGLYSMLGDRAYLDRIVALKERHGFYLMVDEAHSLGVLGPRGRGRAEELGVEGGVDFIVGTFSKSLGGVGGFCVSDHAELEAVRAASRPYIFTASPPPSVIASVRAALRVIASEPELRERLARSAAALYDRLRGAGYRLGPHPGPVIAVRMKSPDTAIAFWRALLDEGIYVNLMLPPATPAGESLVRCSVTAAHTDDQLERIARAFEALAS